MIRVNNDCEHCFIIGPQAVTLNPGIWPYTSKSGSSVITNAQLGWTVSCGVCL